MGNWNRNQNQQGADEFKFEIREHVAAFGTRGKEDDYVLELNFASFNGREPRYDLRRWNSNHTKMSKGMSLSTEELDAMEEFFRK